MTWVFVGIGSNIHPREHVPQALDELAACFGTLRISRAYSCPAVGFDGADFINLVVGFDTDDNVHGVQRALREVEHVCGRDRRCKEASRTMDVDLLLYGDAIIHTAGLTLPRADILEYAFVLRPLAELVPEQRHPVVGVTYARLWADFDANDQPLTPVELD